MAGNKLLKRMPMDFFYNFSTDPAAEGQEIGISSRGDYFYRYGHDEIGDGLFKTDSETILEITGMSLFGPFDAAGMRVPIEYAGIFVNKNPVDDAIINHLTSPMFTATRDNEYWNPQLREAPDSPVSVLFGRGMLSNMANPNDPQLASWQPTIKIGPNSSLDVRMKFPRVSEGGDATITTNGLIRLDVTEVRDEALFQSLLNTNGHLAGAGAINQNVTFGDLESGKVVSIPKTVPATMATWDQCYGGIRATKPLVTRYINYAQNGSATRVNEYYPFEDNNDRVVYPRQEMFWDMPDSELVQITHLGILPHPNLEHIELFKTGNTSHVELRADDVLYQYGMPCPRDSATHDVRGPGKLPRPFTVMPGERGGVRMVDNGTSIPAWAAGVDGVEILAMGYKAYLTEEIANALAATR